MTLCNVPYFNKFQHTLWRQRLEVDVAAKEAELQSLKDARNDDRRLLGMDFITQSIFSNFQFGSSSKIFF